MGAHHTIATGEPGDTKQTKQQEESNASQIN
jgi:hypothetical protein